MEKYEFGEEKKRERERPKSFCFGTLDGGNPLNYISEVKVVLK